MVKDTINLYLSAASDLSRERDLLSRAVVELPVTLGWKINLTPLGNKVFDENLVLESDVHILILGEDIRAPIGLEWYLSRTVGHKPVFLIKDRIPRTMAASDFLRHISSYPKLYTFSSLAEFRHAALLQIGNILIERADYFNLGSVEHENLSSFIQDLAEVEPESPDRVTGEDSIILTRERFTPKGGVLLEAPVEEENHG